jgi:hypothetical protein
MLNLQILRLPWMSRRRRRGKQDQQTKFERWRRAVLQVQAGMVVVATLAAPGTFQQMVDTLSMLPVLEDMFCQRGMPGLWSRLFSQRSHFPAKLEKLLELLVVPLDAAYEGFLLCLARGELDSFYLEIEPEISLTSFAH